MKLKIDKGIKFRGSSLFIKIVGDELEYLDVIRSFNCYYHKNKNMWELPKGAFQTILDKCRDCNIDIVGKIPKEFENYLKLLDNYDKPLPEYESKTVPYSYQMDSFIYSKDHTKFLLADEQGLGKTKQALDIAVSKKGQMKHCLIVCGVNELKWNWVNEVSVHTNEQAHILGFKDGKIGSVHDRLLDLQNKHEEFFLVTNIETLRDTKIQEYIKILCTCGVIGMTIIDEIHKCKNSTSIQGKAIHCCCTYYKLALTGTPIMNAAIDLYNVLKWLEVENHSLTQFKNHYCIMGGFGGYQIVGYKHLDELQSRLDKYMLRRRKEDVLDLPPKIYTNELLEMDAGQTKIYKEVEQTIQDNIDKILLLPNPLTALTRLRQVTGNPDILTTHKVNNVKYKRMVEIVYEVVNNGGKVIIFSNWARVIEPAAELLEMYNPACITSQVKDKDKLLKEFKENPKCKVILGTIGCLGTGFTLNEANTVIFLDEPWSSADKQQAEDRCHRIGTKGTVNIITLICKDTIDEKVHNIVKSKQALSSEVVDNKKLFKDIMEG